MSVNGVRSAMAVVDCVPPMPRDFISELKSPLSRMTGTRPSSIAGYRISSTDLGRAWISSMKRMSQGFSPVRTWVRSGKHMECQTRTFPGIAMTNPTGCRGSEEENT